MFCKFLLALWYYVMCFIGKTFAEDDQKAFLYTRETFPGKVSENNHFIMFYAPWCGYCKRLYPTWDQLAGMINDDPDSEVVIAKVDCTVDNRLCDENDVTGYPTLKFFKLGSSEGVKFRGTRDLPSLTSFINEQMGKEAVKKIQIPAVTINGLTELTDSSFNDFTKDGNFFIKFYAPWCGHCQKLASTWEDLAKSLENDSKVGIAKIDCTVHQTVCDNLDITGYPTLLWLQNGKVIEKYKGERTETDLKSYVNKMLNSKEKSGSPGDEAEKSSSEGVVDILNSENFKSVISKGVSFVKFFAPWCGHCKRLAPAWDELKKKVDKKKISNVRIVKVDCTQEKSKDLCSEQEVDGFPTLYLYKNGEKVSEYTGARNLEDLYEFLSNHFVRDEL